MLRLARIIFLSCLLVCYAIFFQIQDRRCQERDITLEMTLPANFHEIVAGYLKQLSAEILFVRASVFLGGVRPGTSPQSYGDTLANNFDVMTKLYPKFIDPYYYCQSFLTPISKRLASKASSIFETGIAAHPDDFVIRFFYASNFFMTLNEPLKASKAFTDAAKLPKAPSLFGHLAALLSAKGGRISAGLISLRAMLAEEKNELVKTRYREEIAIFEEALFVQEAVDKYAKKYGNYPGSLEQLVAEFLPRLPNENPYFKMIYEPPVVRLDRPERKKAITELKKPNDKIPYYLKPQL